MCFSQTISAFKNVTQKKHVARARLAARAGAARAAGLRVPHWVHTARAKLADECSEHTSDEDECDASD